VQGVQQLTIHSEEFELARSKEWSFARDRQACGISRRSSILTGGALHNSHADKPFTKQVLFIALTNAKQCFADILYVWIFAQSGDTIVSRQKQCVDGLRDQMIAGPTGAPPVL
jgi:hypothetical protein